MNLFSKYAAILNSDDLKEKTVAGVLTMMVIRLIKTLEKHLKQEQIATCARVLQVYYSGVGSVLMIAQGDATLRSAVDDLKKQF
jgi:hypothetical protein